MFSLKSPQVIYHGERKGVIEYFSRIGFECPTNTNPAEYVIDLVSLDQSTRSSLDESKQRIQLLSQLWAAHSLRKDSTAPEKASSSSPSMAHSTKSDLQIAGGLGTHGGIQMGLKIPRMGVLKRTGRSVFRYCTVIVYVESYR